MAPHHDKRGGIRGSARHHTGRDAPSWTAGCHRTLWPPAQGGDPWVQRGGMSGSSRVHRSSATVYGSKSTSNVECVASVHARAAPRAHAIPQFK
jgi:hypothetical protein